VPLDRDPAHASQAREIDGSFRFETDAETAGFERLNKNTWSDLMIFQTSSSITLWEATTRLVE
jgi:hypothetical protein